MFTRDAPRERIDKMKMLQNKSPEIAAIIANSIKSKQSTIDTHVSDRLMNRPGSLTMPNPNPILPRDIPTSITSFNERKVMSIPPTAIHRNATKAIGPIGIPRPLQLPVYKSTPMNVISNSIGPPGNLVSISLTGGLGNWIFKILAGFGYAEKSVKQFVISRNCIVNGSKSHEQGLEHKITRIFPNLVFVDSVPDVQILGEIKEHNYYPIPNYTTNVLLKGYFQDERYFPSRKYIPVIKTDYYANTYFVHIRAGDYLVAGGFGIDLTQYHKSCFASLGSGINYLVFSDDTEYAKKYLEQFSITYTLSDKVDPVDTLIEMANCAGGICANSSFSWLGAFFQGDRRGQIFMPSIWFKGRDCRGVYPRWATVVEIGKFTEVPLDIRNTYNLSDIHILNIPSGKRLNYNACIVDDLLFFRAVNQVEHDDIMVSRLDIATFKCIPNTVKTLQLVSKFNNKHVEDPRAILHNGNYFVCYTDGYNVGIAKLDINYNTIYSHYLKKPDEIRFEGGDGREKNWLPISMGDTIHFWYGDNPRTFLIYNDTGRSLEYVSYIKTGQRVVSKFGTIRGGCPPIPYDDEKQIWFFHTFFEKKYRIGAYLTSGLNVVGITPCPILTGNHIVFPCGAIQYDGDFYVSMGVQDKDIGILKVSRNLEFVPV